ncbi:MAG: DNA adenine methylase [Candidatus Parcubacteria bacterium]|nr:DNA adenine methylase [Candidatus Parcubacteria bacterium]
MNLNNDLSPLRYPGSKKRLTVYLNKIIEKNNLKPGIIVEPFLGGGSVTLFFLANNLIKKAVVSDRDKLVYSFWFVLFHNPERLIRFIKKVDINVDNFIKYKEISKLPENYSKEVVAEACLFLNRTSFSGILRKEVGPIGGMKQKSPYKIDCRFNRESLIKKIKTLSKFKNRITVLNCDWKNTLAYSNKRYKKNEIILYLDPPFYKKADKLYRQFFDEDDHKSLCDALIKTKYSWILSYDKAKEIVNMYSKFKQVHIQLPYSINSHAIRLEEEIIITPLELPKIKEGEG